MKSNLSKISYSGMIIRNSHSLKALIKSKFNFMKCPKEKVLNIEMIIQGIPYGFKKQIIII